MLIDRQRFSFLLAFIALLVVALACSGSGGGPTAPGATSVSGSVGGSSAGTGSAGAGDTGGDQGDDPGDFEDVIRIEKSTNGFDADTSDLAPRLAIGTPITWTYEVSNISSGFLSEIAVTDDQLGAIRCEFERLAAGERGTCTAQGTAEVVGLYRNIGTVRAIFRITPTGFSTRVSDSDTSHYVGVVEEPPPTGSEGCGLGYWKNHLEDWPPTGYSPTQTVDSVFSSAGTYPPLATATLHDALSFGGGPGAEGAAAILLRHAVAALLNAAHPGIAFSRAPSAIVSQVNGALASGNRQQMLSMKDDLESASEGECPLG